MGIKGISGGESRSNLLECFNFKINHLNSNANLLLPIKRTCICIRGNVNYTRRNKEICWKKYCLIQKIITNPSLLFCDEPTSGLDSFMAMSIVESMKVLTSRGKTIICTIHQPSSEIFEQFDRLYLMAEGRLAYTGDLMHAHHFFSRFYYIIDSIFNLVYEN